MKALRTPLLVLLTAGLVLVGLPAPAHAVAAYTVPVYDYVNWFLSLYQRYQQIANQAEQLRRQAKQIEAAFKAIERSGKDGNWASLQGLFANLETLFNSSENLGYLNSQLVYTWDNTFPGYHAPVQSWPADQENRARRTFSTLRGIELALHQVAELNDQSDSSLAVLRDRSDHADTPQKQLETHGMFLDFQATEISRSMQASLLAANAVTVLGTEQLQRSATADLARTSWIEENAPRPLSDFEAEPGYTGVPRDWPWAIHF
jgi:P-type conjugative transfer protein TrbJ